MMVYVEKAEAIKADLLQELDKVVRQHLEVVHEETGLEEFIVGGSWAAAMIAQALTNISDDESEFESLVLKANDVDVYHGTFTASAGSVMSVMLDRIAYKEVEGFPWEINTVECHRLSAENFLANNDLNVTAACLHVDFTTDSLFSFHASPSFWEFVFQKGVDRVIKTVHSFYTIENGATTCVRMSYKSFQLGFKCLFGDIDPTVGTLALSQKKKFDEMLEWVDSPLLDYQCNKHANHFVLAKKHNRVRCTCGKAWINKDCTNKMCKKCCMAKEVGRNSILCKVKSHR